MRIACADVVGECLHLGGLGRVCRACVGLGGGLRAGPLVGRLGAILAGRLAGELGPVEGRRVGVVAGQEADVVLDEVVVVRVVLGELALDVALGVVGEVADDLGVGAVDLDAFHASRAMYCS